MPAAVALVKQIKEARRQPGAALYEVLATRTLDHRESKRVITQEDVFQAFASTGFDYVGQVSTGYSAFGLKVEFEVGLDIGALFAPGFVTLEAKAGLSGEGTKNLLLVMARHPMLIPPGKAGQLDFKSGTSCCFMTLRGAAWTAGAKASATAGVKAGFTLDAKKGFKTNVVGSGAKKEEESGGLGAKLGSAALETLSIGASASATATASASYAGTYMFLRDRHPTYHASWMDQDLRQRFRDCVGVGEKGMIKTRIMDLFKDLPAFWPDAPKLAWWEHITKGITGGRIDFARMEAGLCKAKATLQRADLLSDAQSTALLSKVQGYMREAEEIANLGYFARRGNEDKAVLKANLEKLFENQTLAMYKPELPGTGGNISTASWVTALKEAEDLLKICASKKRRQELSDEIDYHLATIAAFREYDRGEGRAVVSSGEDELLYTGLCHLALWGHNPEVGAQAEAKIEASLLGAISGEATASASAKKSWKWTHYRFQQFVESDNDGTPAALPCLISTQDTSLSYSQTVLQASAGVKATGGFERKAETSNVYNALTYESSLVYWSHPKGPGDSGKATVESMPGSGYVFGQSVRLTTLAEQARAGTEAAATFLEVVASALDVTIEQLREFLAQSWVIDAAGEIPQDVVLLEATFSGAGVPLDVTFESGKANRPILDKDARRKIMEHSRSGTRANLQSIRLRYRMADEKESRTPFRLGIPAGPVTLGITLEAVTKAGAQGIVDLDCYWFHEKSRNTDPASASRRDDTVPPVVIFHQ